MQQKEPSSLPSPTVLAPSEAALLAATTRGQGTPRNRTWTYARPGAQGRGPRDLPAPPSLMTAGDAEARAGWDCLGSSVLPGIGVAPVPPSGAPLSEGWGPVQTSLLQLCGQF